MSAINRRVYSGVWPAAILVSVSNPATKAEAMKRRLVITILPVINAVTGNKRFAAVQSLTDCLSPVVGRRWLTGIL
jgi:hypothetical protein